MEGNQVVLDTFDHPVRDFPELPVALSSRMAGWEIENDLRKNLDIRVYDLVARMPAQPPRFSTLRERATKFREVSGSLSWDRRQGSDNMRNFVLSLLPAGAISTISLGGDLSKEQLADRRANYAAKVPNRRRKTKREDEARVLEESRNAASIEASKTSRNKPKRTVEEELPMIGFAFNSGDEGNHQNPIIDGQNGRREDFRAEGITSRGEDYAQFNADLKARGQKRSTIRGTNSTPSIEGSHYLIDESATMSDAFRSNRSQRGDRQGAPSGVCNTESLSQSRRRKRARSESSSAEEEVSENDLTMSKRQRQRYNAELTNAGSDDDLDYELPRSRRTSQGSTDLSESQDPRRKGGEYNRFRRCSTIPDSQEGERHLPTTNGDIGGDYRL